MPLTAIVVSRDRAAQLDLLLRSVTCHADNLIDSIAVLWTASSMEYTAGYGICITDHPEADFYQEDNFRPDIDYLLSQADDYVMFLTDDSFFYRDVPDVDPCAVMTAELSVISFSLRLGANTRTCYPLKGRDQVVPAFDDGGGYLVWEWATGDADFGYPGSMDGHIFHRKDLFRMIRDNDGWWNPNTLEDVLCQGVYRSLRGDMACFERSVLVGIPANRTSMSHPGNRFGTAYYVDQGWLNAQYLDGGRILFPNIHRDAITAAHQEFDLQIV